jgi:hypothetical protein
VSSLPPLLRCIAIASFALGGLNTACAQKDAPTHYKALLTLSDKGGEQDEVIKDLLITKRALVTSAHVKNAFPDPARVSVIQMELSKAGGAQMRKLTEPMGKGVDRLAVVLDDKDARAPALIDSLSRNFFFTGIEDHATRAAALRALFAENLR